MAEGTGTNIGKAYIQIMPSADGIKGKLESLFGEEGVKAGKGFAGKFSGALGTLGKGMLTATAALGAGAMAAGGAFAAAAGNVASYGDNIDKMSQKMGLSAEKYQEWDAIMQHSGTSMEAMKAGMKTLANAAVGNNKAFQELGFTQEQLAGMSQEQLFEATISALQGVEDTTKRTYLAGKLLGRGATELGPLLNQSAEDTEKMRQRVHDLGGVMSDKAVKASAQFQDSLQDMQTAISGIGRNMLAEFLPGLSGVMDGIGDIFAGRKGTGKIEKGVDRLISAAETAIPKAMKVGGAIVEKLGGAIMQHAPTLLSAGGEMLLTIVRGLVEKLPEVPAAAFAMFRSLSGTLSEQLPELIPVAVEAVLNFVDGLITNSDQLIDGALALMGALVEGVVRSIPILVEKAPVLIAHFVEALARNLPKIVESGGSMLYSLLEGIHNGFWELFQMGADAAGEFVEGVKNRGRAIYESGKDLLDLFIQGIKARIAALVETVKGVAGTVKDYLGFSEPKKGPLSNFHTFAPDMMEGYAGGITENAWRVRRAVEDSVDFADAFREPGVVQMPTVQGWSGHLSTPEPRFVDNTTGGGRRLPESVTVVLQLDKTELGRVVVPLVDEERRRLGVRLAT